MVLNLKPVSLNWVSDSGRPNRMRNMGKIRNWFWFHVPVERALCLFGLPGANPNRRDNGRSLCAEEWARFCGCHNCADAIAKYIRSKKYFFKKTFFQLSKEKWTSEPDLLAGKSSSAEKSRAGGGGWLQRHLSLKRKKSSRPGEIFETKR